MKQTIPFFEAVEIEKWVALFLSICIPSLTFHMTLQRPVTVQAQAAVPWSAPIKGQSKRPRSLCKGKGMSKSEVLEGKMWCYLSAPALR